MRKDRRKFLKELGLASTGLATAFGSLYGSPNKLSAKSYSRVIGANQRIGFAFQGLGRRLPGLLRSTLKLGRVGGAPPADPPEKFKNSMKSIEIH